MEVLLREAGIIEKKKKKKQDSEYANPKSRFFNPGPRVKKIPVLDLHQSI
jgi:hypothetical protein